MKVKLDENITVEAVSLFIEAGHDAATVLDEDLKGADDEHLLAVCVREGRMIVTFDLGFGDVRAHPPGQHAGVLLMRLRDQQPEATLEVLHRFLSAYDLDSLAGALVVVTEENVRIRRP